MIDLIIKSGIFYPVGSWKILENLKQENYHRARSPVRRYEKIIHVRNNVGLREKCVKGNENNGWL